MPAIKGTQVYWRPSSSSPNGAAKQILKNSGYISVTLQGVQYKARGSWWQQAFGGSDKITVSTQVSWLNGEDNKSAASIQDLRKINVPSTNALAIGRIIALKVPASADGLELKTSIHAVHDDNLGKTLQLLNSEEFKQPLQLAPIALGQILTISNLVKKTFTEGETDALSATFPGIISVDEMPNPVAQNRLAEGYIIVLVKQDDADELTFDPNHLTVSGNRLLFKGEPLPNTYIIYNVSFEKWRGVNPTSAFSRKFAEASSKCDELLFAAPEQKKAIVSMSHDLLMQGKGVLDNDDTYRPEERTLIALAAFKAVADKIQANSAGAPSAILSMMGDHVSNLPLLAAAMDVPDEDREAIRNYVQELADSGLPQGFTLNAEELTPAPVAQAEMAILALNAPLPKPACPAQTFTGITAAKWACLQQKAAAAGFAINDPVGEASGEGFTIGWEFDAAAATLQLTCLKKPFWAPCGAANGRLRDLVESCGA